VILELRASLGATVVIVTHELPSIFTIANNSVFLDAETKTMIAAGGDPKELLEHPPESKVRELLTRGVSKKGAGAWLEKRGPRSSAPSSWPRSSSPSSV
jgi:phospholipid/cholesterol/gamma-HCH transport system ATP-binding protein